MSAREDDKRAKATSEDDEARPQAAAEEEERGADGEAKSDEPLDAPPWDEATVRVGVKPPEGPGERAIYFAEAFVRGHLVAASRGYNRHTAFGGAASGLLYYWQSMGTAPPPAEQDPPTP